MVTPASSLHRRYVRGTPKGAVVQDIEVFFCRLTYAVQNGMGFTIRKGDNKKPFKVYLKTRVLKHVYDKKPAEEYDFLIANLHHVVKYPTQIYKNKSSKRGDYCFTKTLQNLTYFCSLEFFDDVNRLEVVTFYRLNKEKYLDNYKLMWSWRNDKPSS